MRVLVLDVTGLDVVLFVVRLGLVGTGLPEDFTAQGVREERLYIRRVGGHDEIQQVSGRRVVGDEVGGSLGDSQVQDLNSTGTLAGGNFPGTLRNLLGVLGSGHQDADRAVENLVHTVQHQIVVVRGQYRGCDLVTAAKY
ncbi:MAG: hypothetical protein HOQ06_13750 [Pseudarthrobacter sp.]|nr:hypothetical protein [Pseudarthrobacter sp.]